MQLDLISVGAKKIQQLHRTGKASEEILRKNKEGLDLAGIQGYQMEMILRAYYTLADQ
jgi:hypothetical protein